MNAETELGLWAASSAEGVNTRPLDADLDVDLAIVGGGFTGCSAALEAARNGARVALLEARRVAFGGSGRNVGLVNAGLWLTPETVVAQMGQSAASRLLSALGEGPSRVFELIEREGIACEAIRAGTLHLAHSPAGLRDLQDRHRQGRAIGAPLELLDAAETARRTGSDRFHGALLDPRAGTVQPLAYCTGLARAAQRAGAQVFEDSPVTRITRDGSGWRLDAGAHQVRAGALLLATNGYSTPLPGAPTLAFSTVHYSQFATAPLPDTLRASILPGGEGCWDTALVMSSIRTDRAGRLIVGGMGNVDGAGGAIHRGWARRKLAHLFPALKGTAIEHAWQGRIAMTADHVPKVLRFAPNALSIFGYSGRGIAPGTVFGTAAAQALLQGRVDAFPMDPIETWTESLTAAKSVYYEAGATLSHAVDPRVF